MTSLLTADNLLLRAGHRTLCSGLSLKVEQGQCWGLLGKNGAGKTSLLHTLAGLRKPAEGTVLLGETPLADLRPAHIAEKIGLLLQESVDALPSTVLETALLGRHPHTKGRLFDDAEDLAIAYEALSKLGIESLAPRTVDSLSGGERQRLALAMLLAQRPRLLLLDEPSNHLDLGFQTPLINLLLSQANGSQRKTAPPSDNVSSGAAVIMATHDINLAARVCDNIVLMIGDGETLVGNALDVLTEDNLGKAYDCPIARVKHEGRTLFYPL